MPRRLPSASGRLVVCLALGAGAAAAQPPRTGTRADSGTRPAARDTTPGYPIHERVVVASCGGCHARDSAGVMSRISFERKTPEGWEASVRRMASLNGARLDPADARAIVRYLADRQGIAPGELRPGRFEVERRLVEYTYAGDAATERTCRACHSMGRVITQRRTRDEWELLLATHRGLYPDVDFQAFRRTGPPPPDSAGAPHPMDQAVAHLARAFPLRTPEWAAWSATMRPPRLEGTWLLTGVEAGRGRIFGRVTVTRTGENEFATRAAFRSAAGGAERTLAGRAVTYTGYQWRGRAAAPGAPADSAWREVLLVEPGWREMSGRWFRGAYDEDGIDVTLTRLGADPAVAGVLPRALRAGARDVELTVVGANLPGALRPADVDLGPGVRVERVVRASPEQVTVRVSVDAAAPPGVRDIYVAGATARAAAVVYDTVSRIRVTPAAGMARVGGVRLPKQYQRFEAVAWWDGPDGKPGTADDLEIGPVPAAWSLEEYGVTYDDDDVRFVGRIDATGLFTPAEDGPNPRRSGSRNNVGDVWAVATWQPDGAAARPLKARAHLLVTVPLYVRWEPARSAGALP